MTSPSDRAHVIAPPPLLLALCLAAGFGAQHFRPIPLFSELPPFQWLLSIGMFVLAAVILFAAIGGMIRHKTHPSPHRPTTAIVEGGVYRFTRNPIYIAFLLIVLAFAVRANNAWLLLSAVILFLLLHFGVVKREERYLSVKFGGVYDEYRQRVRRWL
jgi:protein-S-isoprenylcysteine O-methyltransferase Ste14